MPGGVDAAALDARQELLHGLEPDPALRELQDRLGAHDHVLFGFPKMFAPGVCWWGACSRSRLWEALNFRLLASGIRTALRLERKKNKKLFVPFKWRAES